MIVVREQAMQAKRLISECWRSIAERSLRATPGNETKFYSGMSVDVIRRSHHLALSLRLFWALGDVSSISLCNLAHPLEQFRHAKGAVGHGVNVGLGGALAGH